ncbi:hypothetical protein G6F31_020896 [Rhizopus arrhizus]|nr:hypothetical protein G6F31_020896 [Rhizopus arrhizus]
MMSDSLRGPSRNSCCSSIASLAMLAADSDFFRRARITCCSWRSTMRRVSSSGASSRHTVSRLSSALPSRLSSGGVRRPQAVAMRTMSSTTRPSEKLPLAA